MHVDQSFRKLISRWRLLGRKLSFFLSFYTHLVYAAIFQHNFFKDRDEPCTLNNTSAGEQGAVEALFSLFIDAASPAKLRKHNLSGSEASLRDILVEDIEQIGLIRPMH